MGKGTSHVYGPVLSRRLGVSLGVDLVPYKTCTYDCIYCQLGPTTRLTQERSEYVSRDTVLHDLKEALDANPEPDYITLAGSGEPTLHSGIGEIIHGIRSLTRTPVAILTNGSLLTDRKVRTECGLADVVLPSLDAGDDHTFSEVNRPLPGFTFPSMVAGLEEFRRGFDGQIWLEVMLLKSITDNDDAVSRIAGLAGKIHPDRIHLNTAVRPAPDASVKAVPVQALERFADFFSPKAQISFYPIAGSDEPELPLEIISETVSRRPCTLEEIARMMNLAVVEVLKITDEMVRTGRLRIVRHGGKNFYTAVPDHSTDSGSNKHINGKG